MRDMMMTSNSHSGKISRQKISGNGTANDRHFLIHLTEQLIAYADSCESGIGYLVGDKRDLVGHKKSALVKENLFPIESNIKLN
ncbi:hypothetical protein [Pleionea litopenaei]|uniref:Uncharacterized protein n=1 Tax=Pleionea litopenaei TaxID=3070815 RepID=A0AA51X6N5_9GAMM|nr:hypothetical protein [Pleionea sp. HL-JVS1]WMS87039.1 hypothetical protein Q9312_17635 [Pleionea sp. HL-JVS1]